MSSNSYKYNSASEGKIDFIAFVLYLILVTIGLVNIYSVTSDVNQTGFHLSTIATKQIIWIGGAALIILTVIFANVTIIDYFSYYAYIIAILLNVAVLFLGKDVNGAKSWFGFGGFGIQPSEFAKVATAMALAKFLGTYGIKFKGWKNIGISIGIFILPMMIILVQNDTGSALVFMSFFLVLYREGMPGYFLVSAVWLGILSIISIILEQKLAPHFWMRMCGSLLKGIFAPLPGTSKVCLPEKVSIALRFSIRPLSSKILVDAMNNIL